MDEILRLRQPNEHQYMPLLWSLAGPAEQGYYKHGAPNGAFESGNAHRACNLLSHMRQKVAGELGGCAWDVERGISAFWDFPQVKNQKAVQELIQLLDLCSAGFQPRRAREITYGEHLNDLFCAWTQFAPF